MVYRVGAVVWKRSDTPEGSADIMVIGGQTNGHPMATETNDSRISAYFRRFTQACAVRCRRMFADPALHSVADVG